MRFEGYQKIFAGMQNTRLDYYILADMLEEDGYDANKLRYTYGPLYTSHFIQGIEVGGYWWVIYINRYDFISRGFGTVYPYSFQVTKENMDLIHKNYSYLSNLEWDTKFLICGISFSYLSNAIKFFLKYSDIIPDLELRS